LREKLCPICSKRVRSDADVHKYCMLCGMGIPDYLSSVSYKEKEGKIIYFCCSRCYSIYEKEFINQNKVKRIWLIGE